MLAWTCQSFAELDARALYEILCLRAQVFVLEQRCIYLDPDGLDAAVWHLQGHGTDGTLRWRESVAEGLASAPEAFFGLLKGRNFGKQLVRLG